MNTDLIIKKNLPRIVAMTALSAAIYFNIKSILNSETSAHHENYNIASAVTPLGTLFNVAGRIHDHWHHSQKKINITAGFAALAATLLATGFSVASAMKDFKQPISLPVLFQSIIIFFITGLNWEPAAQEPTTNEPTLNEPTVQDSASQAQTASNCSAIAANNAGRIFALGGIGVTAGLSISSIVNNDKRLFFAANTALGVASLGESSNRVYDITVTNKDETTLVNKSCAVLFFLLILAETITSALSTAELWKNQPIALPGLIKNAGMILYMLAQFKFMREQPAIDSIEVEDRHSEAEQSAHDNLSNALIP